MVENYRKDLEYLSSFLSGQFSKWKPSVYCVNELSVGVKNKIASVMMTKQAGLCNSLNLSSSLFISYIRRFCICFRLKNGFKMKEKLHRYCRQMEQQSTYLPLNSYYPGTDACYSFVTTYLVFFIARAQTQGINVRTWVSNTCLL